MSTVFRDFFLKINLLISKLFSNKIKLYLKLVWIKLNHKINFLNLYYIRNENIWQDGFLFDFLQKKSIDIWLRKFVIYTGFLFSERFVFDYVIKIYIDNLIWPSHNIFFVEVKNVSEMLTSIIFSYIIFFLLLFSFYILIL